MDSTMRAHMRRVHSPVRRALLFLLAGAGALQAWAQGHCGPASDDAQVQRGAPVRVSAYPGGKGLRVDADGRRCELQPDGRLTAWALSGPGQPTVLAVATAAPLALTFYSANLQVLQRVPLRDRTGQPGSPICTLLVSPQRQSFVAVFSATGELWELSYNPLAAEIGVGMVHDFQYREGHFVPGYLNPLRTALPWNAAAAGLDAGGHMVQLLSDPNPQRAKALVIHLDVRKPVPETAHAAEPLRTCQDGSLL